MSWFPTLLAHVSLHVLAAWYCFVPTFVPTDGLPVVARDEVVVHMSCVVGGVLDSSWLSDRYSAVVLEEQQGVVRGSVRGGWCGYQLTYSSSK